MTIIKAMGLFSDSNWNEIIIIGDTHYKQETTEDKSLIEEEGKPVEAKREEGKEQPAVEKVIQSSNRFLIVRMDSAYSQ